MPITEDAGFGAAITPEQWATFVLDHLAAASVLLASGATEIRTSAKQIHVPRVTGDSATGWYDELEPIGEGAPPGDELVLAPKKVATLVNLSNEAVNDSDPAVLDVTGTAMTRSVAREADRAMFAGTGGKQPLGLLNLAPALPSHIGAVDYAGVVTAAGLVRAAGGVPNVLYINPTDLTALQLAADANDRPLVADPATGMGASVAGLTIWPTPAVPAATAIIAQADQVIVGVREDASVVVSEHALFASDGTVARVIARVDVGVNDPDGLCVVKAAAVQAAKSKSSS